MDAKTLVYPDILKRIARAFGKMKATHDLDMRVCQGLRSFQEQAKIFAQGRTAPGPKISWAQPGSSMHNYGLAVDCCFLGGDPWLDKNPQKEAIWNDFGLFCKEEGLTWGGYFSGTKTDKPHAELTYGLTLPQLRALYKQGKILQVWEKCDQLRCVKIGSEWVNLRDQLKKL